MFKSLHFRLLAFVVTGVSLLNISAKPVSPEGAVARLSTASYAPGIARNHADKAHFVRSITTPSGQKALYLYNLANRPGYLVLPADDRFMPLLGYSDSGNISDKDLPDGLRWWLTQMTDEIEYALQADEEPRGVYTPPSLGPAVGPLLKTEWGQTEPYNMYTPVINEKQSPTGCVATALSQIMYYHNWPVNPQGQISYDDTSKPANNYYMTFDGITFQWDMMTDIYGEESSLQSKEAVATLMKAVGYGVQMTYGASSSGATDKNAIAAMKSFFNYSDDAQLIRRESLNRNEWDGMLYAMISAGLPIYYTGRDAVWMGSGGHAFVCDGYDGNGYFHYNWGWDGKYNGYFLTTCLVPSGAGTGGYINGYNYTQSIMVNLHPDDDKTYDLYDFVSGMDFSLSIPDNSVSADLTPAGIANEYKSGLAVNRTDAEEEIKVVPLGTIGSGLSSWQLPADLFESLDKDGLYDLRLIWKTSDNDNWQRVFPISEGLLIYTRQVMGGHLAYNDDKWVFTEDIMDLEPINVEIADLRLNDEDYYISGSSNIIEFKMINVSNDYEFHATRCYAIDSAGNSTIFFNTSLDVEPSGSSSYKYSINNTKTFPSGEYLLYFINVNTLQQIPTDKTYIMTVYDDSNILKIDDGTFVYSILPEHPAILTGTVSGEKVGGNVVIPAKITYEGQTYTVGKLLANFSSYIDKENVTSLRIDFPLTELSNSAIYNFAKLEELYLPETIRSIGEYACAFNKEMRVLSLPERLDNISSSAFSYCYKLENLKIPVVETIPDKCFYGPESLTEIIVPEGVRHIGASAFYNWKVLKTIKLPSTLESIDKMAFGGFTYTTNIETVEVAATTPPTIEDNTFGYSTTKNAVLKVPNGYRDAYMADPKWSKFQHIEEANFVTAIDEIDEDHNTECVWYTTDGIRLQSTPDVPGLYIRVSNSGKTQKTIIR